MPRLNKTARGKRRWVGLTIASEAASRSDCEGILGELPKINRGIALVQVISVVSPLLGLLGTVIGMILTFQAITLFGTGDPKTMASGISKALMTTVLGLVVAIPTTLLHAIVSSQSKSIIHVIEEQSAGIIAKHAESSGRSIG